MVNLVKVVVSSVLFFVLVMGEKSKVEPMYKYRYETEDFMQASPSEVPIRGYHTVEGKFYPQNTEIQPNYARFEPNFGYQGFAPFRQNFGYDNFYRPFWHGGFRPQFNNFHGHPHGYVDKKAYADEKKNSEDQKYEKAEGAHGESGHHGKQGYSKGETALKDSKEDSGSYKDENGYKKGFDDAKEYFGGNHFNHNGENTQNKKGSKGHKKGHSRKGFKTTHHKDESGSTESYYDEANDEGNNYFYDGNSGKFGENGHSAFKGGHENNKFEEDHNKKQGHYNSHKLIDNVNEDKGGYDHKGYHGNEEVYKINNGIGQHSLLGKQEANREYHHYPHVPFYPYGYRR